MTRTVTKQKRSLAKKVSTRDEPEKAPYFNWPNRGRPADDPTTDWYEAENKWRDNIVPENND